MIFVLINVDTSKEQAVGPRQELILLAKKALGDEGADWRSENRGPRALTYHPRSYENFSNCIYIYSHLTIR